jgi:hypothetical protein
MADRQLWGAPFLCGAGGGSGEGGPGNVKAPDSVNGPGGLSNSTFPTGPGGTAGAGSAYTGSTHSATAPGAPIATNSQMDLAATNATKDNTSAMGSRNTRW